MMTTSNNSDTDSDSFSPDNLIHEFPLSCKKDFQNAVEIHGTMSCEYHLVNLFCWYGAYHLSWCHYKGRILIYNHTDNIAFMPLGSPMDTDELVTLSKELARHGLGPDICLASRDYIKSHPDIKDHYTIEPKRNVAEYLYLTEKMVALQGTKLHKKRNLISQFERKYQGYGIHKIDASHKDMICNFSKRLLNGISPLPNSLKNEYKAITRAMEYFDELGMEGLYIEINDELIAYSLFSPINAFTYDIHFEKANYAYKGAAQIINWESAKFLEGKCKYLNREQDLGVKGLRQAKLSYEPEMIFIPHVLKYKGN